MTETPQPRPVAVVTGASEGIGAELARVFAANGHEVALVARRGDKLEALAEEIAATGKTRPTTIELDLLGVDAVETLAKRLADAGMTAHYLVNNAGFGLLGKAVELDAAEQLAMIDLNVRMLTALTLRFLPEIVASKGGVLNVASTAAFMPGPGFAIYYATKAYVLSFSEALAQEVSASGAKVATLCPGPVKTGFQARAGFDFSGPMGLLKPALMPAEEVARQGYDGIIAGKRVIVPGVVNKVLASLAPFTPRAVLLPVLERAQKKR